MAYGTCNADEEVQPQSNVSSSDASINFVDVYSTFSKAQKRSIIFLTGFTSMFSPLSGSIYFPAIPFIAKDLHVSIELINLTITSYMIVSGIAPTLLGDMADQIGRRPIYLSMMLIYMAANIGLALQSSYPALLVLRMVQSFGCSGEASAASLTGLS
jgi:MFS family permease